jgi:hypothetical protein
VTPDRTDDRADPQHGPSITLRARLERSVNTGIGSGAVIAVAGGFTGYATGLPEPWLLAFCLPGAYAAIRSLFLRVRIEPDQVIIVGLWRTQRIPRSSIIEVTEFPSVRWRTPNGTIRKTPMLAFADVNNRDTRRLRDYNAAMRAEIRRQLSGYPTDASSGAAPIRRGTGPQSPGAPEMSSPHPRT